MSHPEYKTNYGNTVILFWLVQECLHEEVTVKFRSGQPFEGGAWVERRLLQKGLEEATLWRWDIIKKKKKGQCH